MAKEDFSGILDYLLDNWNETVAENFMETTFEAINYISIHPAHFPIINRKLKIRKCVLSRHNSLFYRDEGTTIALLRFFDTRQNPEKLKFK